MECVQPRLAVQPIDPLIEVNYITLLKNQRLKQKQVSKKVIEAKVSELSGSDKTVFEPGVVSREKNQSVSVGKLSNINRMSGMMFILLIMSNIGFVWKAKWNKKWEIMFIICCKCTKLKPLSDDESIESAGSKPVLERLWPWLSYTQQH